MTSSAGAAFSLMAAVSWAVAIVLFKRSGDDMSPLALNYFKNVVGLALLGVTLLVTGSELVPPGAQMWDVLFLIASGAIGIGAADTLLFRSLNILGAGRSAIVACAYSPLIILFSFLLLGERLTWLTAVGATLVLAAVALLSRQQSSTDIALAKLVEGVVLGLLSVALMGIAIVAVKPILERYPVLWSTTVRMLGGALVLTILTLARRTNRAAVRSAFVPRPVWRYAVPGSIVGTYVALLFWIAGFKYAEASTASILNQTSTLLVVVLAAIFLGEPLNRAKVGALLLGSMGAVLALL